MSISKQSKISRPHEDGPWHGQGQGNKEAGSRSLLAVVLLLCTVAVQAACDPYPDQGEFIAGVVYAANFIPSVKAGGLTTIGAVGQGREAVLYPPYTIVAAKGTSANSPLWSDGKRDPLSVMSAQQVYVFDGACQAPDNYVYNQYFDVVQRDKQYPVFQDIPEFQLGSDGKPIKPTKVGRTGTYSAIVQVIHLQLPAGFPCQSVTRFDTAAQRAMSDLKPAPTGAVEYRLMLIFDPVLTLPPYEPVYKLGFFNQLVVPYIDMGPVPVSAGTGGTGGTGGKFATMPVYNVSDAMGNPAYPTYDQSGAAGMTGNLVVGGTALEMAAGAPAYSPVCSNVNVALMGGVPAPNAGDMAFAGGMPAGSPYPCLVCKTVNANGDLDCPFARKGGVAR